MALCFLSLPCPVPLHLFFFAPPSCPVAGEQWLADATQTPPPSPPSLPTAFFSFFPPCNAVRHPFWVLYSLCFGALSCHPAESPATPVDSRCRPVEVRRHPLDHQQLQPSSVLAI
uniref:Uncharacterized protein n=1 Tax=Opuntia streptacantha TaxID=393608 RepID=A0A7C9D0Z3_OPUST